MAKLFDKEIYCIGTVRTDRKNMAVMKKDNVMKRGDIDFQCADNIVPVKWYDNCGVALVGTCLESCNQISSVSRRLKDKSPIIPVPCPSIVKEYNNGMSGVDLLDQRTAAYKFDRKSSSGRYYLILFFDLTDIAIVNSRVVYKLFIPKA